jgi:glutamate synthase domain-containing protein 2
MPYSDGRTLELAYLRAIDAVDSEQDIKTRSLVGVQADDFLEGAGGFTPYARHILPRFTPEDLGRLLDGVRENTTWQELLDKTQMVELVWHSGVADSAARLCERWPNLMVSIFLRYSGGFWPALAESVAAPQVSLVHVHAGERKSYRLIPQVDAFLKSRLERSRVQLVNAGGDTDAVSSAAAVYESILLGANGGAMTDLASIALVPELIDVYHGADPRPVTASLAGRDGDQLFEQALSTLLCWQHSILDFLSCMGIDDVQKTSGNTMAIVLTEDWAKEIDGLATAEFAERNRALNESRLASEAIPPDVRRYFRVSNLMSELSPRLNLVAAAQIQEQRTANWHLENTNHNLTGDYLEMIFRMAAGFAPETDDFFLQGDSGPASLDGIRLRLSSESVEWSLERLRRDPALLDYIQLAVPRGFHRPGAVASGAQCDLRVRGSGAAAPLARWTADRHGGFEVRLTDAQSIEAEIARGANLEVAVSGAGFEEVRSIPLQEQGHGGSGLSVVQASADGQVILKRHPTGGYVLSGLGIRAPLWQSPVSHASISLGAASEDFLTARLEGNEGLAMVSSGEGGPIRFESGNAMDWESLQAASAHFGIHASDLRRVLDVEIKINQGAKPGKGGRLAGAKVTPQVSRARNIPIGTDALSPDPKHDIYSIEDMPAEVWLWLLYHTHCGIKISGSTYTKYVAAGMWSNFIVDYLLIDAGLAGSGNYHADSSHVGWPDIFRTILHTHHELVNEQVDLDHSGKLRTIRDDNGAPFGATGGTRLFASGGPGRTIAP